MHDTRELPVEFLEHLEGSADGTTSYLARLSLELQERLDDMRDDLHSIGPVLELTQGEARTLKGVIERIEYALAKSDGASGHIASAVFDYGKNGQRVTLRVTQSGDVLTEPPE